MCSWHKNNFQLSGLKCRFLGSVGELKWKTRPSGIGINQELEKDCHSFFPWLLLIILIQLGSDSLPPGFQGRDRQETLEKIPRGGASWNSGFEEDPQAKPGAFGHEAEL